MYKVFGVTLARGGSKGIPGKNIKPLAGTPLVEHTITQALRSQLITDYVVSTDSEEIAAVSEAAGAWVPFLRPKALAQDTSTSVDALVHAVETVEAIRQEHYDFIVELMATNPFKTSTDIDYAVQLLIETGADSVIAMQQVEEFHPARIKRLEGGMISDFCTPELLESRRQDLTPKAFIRCGAIYALTRTELMVNRRRYGSHNSVGFELGCGPSVNIDSELDWVVAEYLLTRRGGTDA